MERNIFANFHGGQKQAYVYNFCPSVQEMINTGNYWITLDVPAVLINSVPLDVLYNNPTILDAYRVAYTGSEYRMWKLNLPKSNPQTIYLIRPLWEKHKDQILAEASPLQKKLLSMDPAPAVK